jgi:hypothetical protein
MVADAAQVSENCHSPVTNALRTAQSGDQLFGLGRVAVLTLHLGGQDSVAQDSVYPVHVLLRPCLPRAQRLVLTQARDVTLVLPRLSKPRLLGTFR